MKKILSFLIYALIPLLSFSQTTLFNKETSTTVEDKKTKERVANFKAVGSFDNSFTYLFLPLEGDVLFNDYYRIEKYDLNMKLVKSKELSLKEKKKPKKLNELIYFQDKLYLFTSFRNVKQKTVYLFVQTVDKKTFSINNDIKEIAGLQYEDKKAKYDIETTYSISEDGSKLLISANLEIPNSKQNKKDISEKLVEEKQHNLYVFDEGFDLLWEEKAESALSTGLFVFGKYYIDNSANVYITGKLFENKIDLAERYTYKSRKFLGSNKAQTFVQSSNYKQGILFFGKKGTLAKQIELKLNGILAKSFTIKPLDNSIFCAGIYSLPQQVSAKGVFSCLINVETGEIEKEEVKVFNEKNLTPTLNSTDLKKFQRETTDEEWDPFHYSLSNLKVRKNGEYVFIAEKQLLGKMISTTADFTNVYSSYTYQDLLVIQIRESGKIKKVNLIEKRQFGISSVLLSYSSVLTEDKIYLIFNNMPLENDLMRASELKNTYLVSLDSEGVQTKEVVSKFDEINQKTLFMKAGKTLLLPNSKGFIYPMQTPDYRYRTYEKITIRP